MTARTHTDAIKSNNLPGISISLDLRVPVKQLNVQPNPTAPITTSSVHYVGGKGLLVIIHLFIFNIRLQIKLYFILNRAHRANCESISVLADMPWEG